MTPQETLHNLIIVRCPELKEKADMRVHDMDVVQWSHVLRCAGEHCLLGGDGYFYDYFYDKKTQIDLDLLPCEQSDEFCEWAVSIISNQK